MKRQQIIDIREAAATLEYVKLRHLGHDVYIRKQNDVTPPPVLIPHTFVDGKDIDKLPMEHLYKQAISLVNSKESIAIEYMGYKIKELPEDIEEVNIELVEPTDFYKKLALTKLSPASQKTSKTDELVKRFVKTIPSSKSERKYAKLVGRNHSTNKHIRRAIKDAQNLNKPINCKLATKKTNIQTRSTILSSKAKFYTDAEIKAKQSKHDSLDALRQNTRDARFEGRYPFKTDVLPKSLVCLQNSNNGVVVRVTRKESLALKPEDGWLFVAKAVWKQYVKSTAKDIQALPASNRAQYRFSVGKRKLKRIGYTITPATVKYVVKHEQIDVDDNGKKLELLQIKINPDGKLIRTRAAIPQFVKTFQRLSKEENDAMMQLPKKERQAMQIVTRKVLYKAPIMPAQLSEVKPAERTLPKAEEKVYSHAIPKGKTGIVINETAKIVTIDTAKLTVKDKKGNVTIVEYPTISVKYTGCKKKTSTKQKKWRCKLPAKKVNPVKSK